MSKKGLYKYYVDCGRQGELSGLFISDKDTVEKAIGKQVYFGEVLGKHSEIFGELEADEIELVTEDELFIKLAEEYCIEIGYNPLNYIEGDE